MSKSVITPKTVKALLEAAAISTEMPVESCCIKSPDGIHRQGVALFVQKDAFTQEEYLIEMEGNEPKDSELADFFAALPSIAQAYIEMAEKQNETCEWKQWTGFYGGDTWSTSCGEDFTYIEGSPLENHAKFCHSCGKKIVEIKAPLEES